MITPAAGVHAVVVGAEFIKGRLAAAFPQRGHQGDGNKSQQARREPLGLLQPADFHGQHQDAPDEEPDRHHLHRHPQKQQAIELFGKHQQCFRVRRIHKRLTFLE